MTPGMKKRMVSRMLRQNWTPQPDTISTASGGKKRATMLAQQAHSCILAGGRGEFPEWKRMWMRGREIDGIGQDHQPIVESDQEEPNDGYIYGQRRRERVLHRLNTHCHDNKLQLMFGEIKS